MHGFSFWARTHCYTVDGWSKNCSGSSAAPNILEKTLFFNLQAKLYLKNKRTKPLWLKRKVWLQRKESAAQSQGRAITFPIEQGYFCTLQASKYIADCESFYQFPKATCLISNFVILSYIMASSFGKEKNWNTILILGWEWGLKVCKITELWDLLLKVINPLQIVGWVKITGGR